MPIRHVALRVLVVLLVPAIAAAARIDVPAGTPLQTAVDAAAPGDTLVLEPGTYPGAVVIDKRLRIAGQGTAVIDPLGAPVGVDITADNVTIRVRESVNAYGLNIGCATDAALRIHGRNRIRIRSAVAGCLNGTTAVGLDMMSVTHANLRFMVLFGGTALSVQQLGVRPAVSFTRVDAHGADLGVLLQDVAAGGGRSSGVRFRKGLFTVQSVGPPAMRLVSADGTVLVGASLVNDLELDAGSDDNLVRGCTMGVVTDSGMGNCFVNNDSPTPDVCP